MSVAAAEVDTALALLCHADQMRSIRLALAQINPMVGDVEGNADLVIATAERAQAAGADLVVFPELAVTGYPPEDLVLRPGFVAENRRQLQRIAASTGSCSVIVGYVEQGRDLYNAAAVCANGEVVGTYSKRLLPNYSVFDEQRYFVPGDDPYVAFEIAGVLVGVTICEDVWSPDGPLPEQAAGGIELVVNLNASPFFAGRIRQRQEMLSTRAADAACVVAYVNQVGGQDELVFDGGSMVLDSDGTVLARAPQFVEHLLLADVQVGPVFRKRLLDPRGRPMAPTLPTVVVSQRSRSSSQVKTPTADSAEGAEANADSAAGAPGSPGAPAAPVAVRLAAEEETYRALVLGTRDYVRKNGFSDVVIGLSGGIDSTLVAVIAADALGPERVHGVSMPSRFSSDGSRNDARALAERLGIDFQSIPIEAIHAQYLATLDPVFAGRAADLTEENLQARIRGALLMALSNKFGWMVLTTGNKSEAAVGYMTLYGDMCGGYAVLMDVLKTDVYDLCRWRNASAGAEVISEAVLTKPPSAELRPDQRDDQSLPPYEVLDPILRGYVERDLTIDDLVDSGFARALVERIARLVDRAEYKRRQAPPGIRVTPKAFGRDRRLPITNRFPG